MSGTMVILALILAPILACPGESDRLRFVESHLRAPAELIGYKAYDLDLDGDEDFVLVSRDPSGHRSLALFYQNDEGGFAVQPDTRIPVKSDVVAYCIADVRPDAGREIVFLTRSGLFSYSPRIEGYRNNVARLARIDLLYDVPDPDELPFWPYVVHRDPEPDQIVAPGKGYLVVLEPDENLTYRIRGTIDTPPRARGTVNAELRLTSSSLSVGFRSAPVHLLGAIGPPEGIGPGEILLSVTRWQPAPLLTDIDGDGATDLLALSGTELLVHAGTRAGGFSPGATRREDLSDLFDIGEDRLASLRLEPVDIDRDGLIDLVVSPDEEDQRRGDDGQRIDLYRGRPGRLIGSQPDRRFKFDALRVEARILDVDDDGRPDLVALAWNTPSGPQAIGNVSIERTLRIYPGDEDGLPGHTAELSESVRYAPEEILTLGVMPTLAGDFDGDGLHDLVDVDREGAVVVRRLERTTSFLGGESLRLATEPLLRFQSGHRVRATLALELGQDTVADLIVEGSDEIAVFVSRSARPAGGR